MRRADRVRWIDAHASERSRGFYLDGDAGQPNPSDVYCEHHGPRMARLLTKRTGVRYQASSAWAGSDSTEWCAIVTCGVRVDTGGLTSCGVDSALAIDQPGRVSIDDLSEAAEAMMPDDQRWTVWMRHARRAMKKAGQP